MDSPIELRKRASSLHGEAKALLGKEDPTRSEVEEADSKLAEVQTLRAQADAIDLNDKLEIHAITQRTRETPTPAGAAVAEWMRGGNPSFEGIEGHMISPRGGLVIGLGGINEWMRMTHDELRQARNVSDFSDAATIANAVQPRTVSSQVVRAMRRYNSVMDVADMVPTSDGNPFTYPTVDPRETKGVRLNSAQLTAEDLGAGTYGGTTLPVGRDSQVHDAILGVTLNAFTYSSRPRRVTEDVLDDTEFDIEGLITSIMGESLGRITADEFTMGAGGTTSPQGIVNAGSRKTTALTASATNVSYDTLVDMRVAVDAAYRGMGTWMMNSATEGVLMKLKDNQNRPIWTEGFTEDSPGRLINRPVIINDVMDGFGTTGDIAILFGELSMYKVRQIRGITMFRLNELFRTANQVGFVAFIRTDARLVDPTDTADDGTRAIVRLESE